MKKFIKCIYTVLIILSISTLLIPSKAQAASETKNSLQRFLDWYAEHKNSGGEYFLDENLVLSTGTLNTPILLDGTGGIELYCNDYSLIVQSNVVIDNKNLFISSKNNKNPAVILKDNGVLSNARLTLKNGTIIARSTVGLYISSGELICPQGKDRFTISSWGESPTGLTVIPPNILLSNLDIWAFGSGEITGINAGLQLQLQNCMISAEAEIPNSGIVTGVKANRYIRLSNTSVIAQGDNSMSVVCTAGTAQIEADKDCTIVPLFALPPESNAICRVTKVLNPAPVNVPIGISPNLIKLPEALECQIVNSSGSLDLVQTTTIRVNWDTDNLAARLQKEGELVVRGTFSTEQLEEEHTYMPASFNPVFTIRVIPTTAMNKILFSEIEPNHSPPFVNIYMQRPYGADSLYLEYSGDGVNWERGYCIRSSDSTKEYNILLYDPLQSTALMVPIYLSEVGYNGQIRAVVSGGTFSGTWGPVLLNPDNLFTPPGQDGGGGDRGGSGMKEPVRKPVLPLPDETIPDDSTDGTEVYRENSETNDTIYSSSQPPSSVSTTPLPDGEYLPQIADNTESAEDIEAVPDTNDADLITNQGAQLDSANSSAVLMPSPPQNADLSTAPHSKQDDIQTSFPTWLLYIGGFVLFTLTIGRVNFIHQKRKEGN